MKALKRIGVLFLSAMLACSVPVFSVSAAGGTELSDWTNFPGYIYYDGPQGTKTRAATPGVLTQTAEGIQFECDGYYKVGDDHFSGFVLNEKVAIDGLSFELILNKVPGVDESSGGQDDVWFSVNFLDKPEMFFSQSTDKGGRGIATNFRPGTRDVLAQMFWHLSEKGSSTGWQTLSAPTIRTAPKEGAKFTFEFRKEGSYVNLYINNRKQTNVWSQLMNETFPDRKGYLVISTSTDTATPWSITLSKLNGVSLGKEGATTPDPDDGDDSDTTRPPTGGTSSVSTPNDNNSASSNTNSNTPGTSSNNTASNTASGTDASDVGTTASDNVSSDLLPDIDDTVSQVELNEALQSRESYVEIDYDSGTLKVEQGKTIGEIKSALILADGYDFKFYDINNNEITADDTAISNLMTGILYRGEVVEKIFAIDTAEHVSGGPGSVGMWVGIIIAVVIVLAGAGVGIFFFLKKKKSA